MDYIFDITTDSLVIKGSKLDTLKVVIDNEKYEIKYNFRFGRDYVCSYIKNKRGVVSEGIVILPKAFKQILVYRGKKVIYTCNKDDVLAKKTLKYLGYLKRGPRVLVKVGKILRQHHFVIPPRMLKQYISSFGNNIRSNSLEELYYNPLNISDYNKWLVENEEKISYKKFKYEPLISIVIPVYNAPAELLTECIESVLNQSYTNFEVCLADDCSSKEETLEVLKSYEQKEKIKIVYRKENGHISKASNSALELASGEFIGLLDNDDVLDKDALYYVVERLNEDKTLDFIYSDEDKLDFEGRRCYPFFKPDFSLDTLMSVNYICHFAVIRKSIIDKIGGFRSEYNGAQDYDLFLRVIDETRNISHIAKVLYHWRMSESSTAAAASNKNYAYIAGKKALEDYLKRNEIKGVVNYLEDSLAYDIEYAVPENALVSIIIPTKDKADVLDRCLVSIYTKSDFSNFEIIVIDNNSEEEKTKALLEKYKSNYDNFSYYRYECEFNYSYLNNEAVKKAKGDYLLFLNNDTEVISKNWLSRMIGLASLEHVGCVGAKLLYPNGTIQHNGIIVGVGGIGTHYGVHKPSEDNGYFGKLSYTSNCAGVTAACLMIKRDKFVRVNGFEEKLKVAFNDVDFNLKILASGYYNVVMSQVKLFHYESLSRGNDLDFEKQKRCKGEVECMCDKWPEKLLRDAFYNDNLSYEYPYLLDKKDDVEE